MDINTSNDSQILIENFGKKTDLLTQNEMKCLDLENWNGKIYKWFLKVNVLHLENTSNQVVLLKKKWNLKKKKQTNK